MKNERYTVQEKETRSAIAVLLATVLATVITGVAIVTLLYLLLQNFQS